MKNECLIEIEFSFRTVRFWETALPVRVGLNERVRDKSADGLFVFVFIIILLLPLRFDPQT